MRRSFNTKHRMNIGINSSGIDSYNRAAIVALRRLAASKKLFSCAGKSYVRHTCIYRAYIFLYSGCMTNARAMCMLYLYNDIMRGSIRVHCPYFSSDVKLPFCNFIGNDSYNYLAIIDVNIKIIN